MTRARDLAKLGDQNNFSVDGSNNVGLGSTIPDSKLDVVGILSATSFYGDGSTLAGVGLGTVLGTEGALNAIYYTNDVLDIHDTTTITVPTGSDKAYTQYQEVVVANTKDLIISAGDEFIPDVLGLSTSLVSPISGSGGRVRADFFTNHAGTGAPEFQSGLTITGTVTGTSSASFGGQVSAANGNVILAANSGITINDGIVDVYAQTTNAAGEPLRIQSDIGSTKNKVAVIKADGSAEFAGDASFKTVKAQSPVAQIMDLFAGFGGSSQVFAVDESGNLTIGSNVANAGTTNINLNTDGSAEFAGTIKAGSTDLSGAGSWVQNNGLIALRTDSASTSMLTLYYNGNSGSDVVADIKSSGTSTFGQYDSSVATGYGAKIQINANSGQIFTQIQDTGSQFTDMINVYFGSSKAFHVLANGNVQNLNNSYGQISDVSLKENIVDANSQWADIKAVKVRNFNFKEGQTHKQIGVVAQEIETVSPGLVFEDDNNLKGVSHSILYMKAIKALQEAMSRIETLETQNAALETRLTALES